MKSHTKTAHSQLKDEIIHAIGEIELLLRQNVIENFNKEKLVSVLQRWSF